LIFNRNTMTRDGLEGYYYCSDILMVKNEEKD
jgi:dihydroorotase